MGTDDEVSRVLFFFRDLLLITIRLVRSKAFNLTSIEQTLHSGFQDYSRI